MPSALHRYKAAFFKALAHPLRLAILDALREGEKSVSALQRELGVEQSLLSRQLSLLRERGLVEARREGQMVYYRTVDPEVYAFLDLGYAKLLPWSGSSPLDRFAFTPRPWRPLPVPSSTTARSRPGSFS